MSKSLEIQLRVDVAKALQRVTALEKGLRGVGKTPAGPSKGLRKTNALLGRMRGSMAGVSEKMNSMAKVGMMALGAGLVAGATAGGIAIMKLGVQMEQTRVRFRTMLGDAKKGDAVLAKLNKFANVTPFTNDQVITAGKTLLSYGVPAEKLQETLKTVGDVAAGSGKDFTELSAIVGKVMSKGKADTESLNQMAEAGIPIVKTLGKAYGVPAAAIYKMAEKGQLSGDVINAAFKQMTSAGGIFANMMEKQSQTAGGMWSTAVGKMQFFAATLGEKLTPLLKVGLGYVIRMANKLTAMTSDGTLIAWLVSAGKTGTTVFADILKAINNMYEAGKGIFQSMAENYMGQFSLIAGAAKIAVSGIVTYFYDMVNNILKAYNWVMGKFGKGGVELIKKPGWVDKLETEGKSDVAVGVGLEKRVWSGKVIGEAMDRAQSKNSTIDKGVAKINKALDSLTKDVKTGAVSGKKKMDVADIPFPVIAAAAEKASKAKTASAKTASTPSANLAKSADRVSVDRLAKVGMYNFGSSAKSADSKRDGLLKQILDKLGSRPEYRLA